MLGLVPLNCPSCGSSMSGTGRDILFTCGHCGSGAVLEGDGLRFVECLALIGGRSGQATTWRIAWLIDAEVEISQRMAVDARPSSHPQERRRFLVPAFDIPLQKMTMLAQALARVGYETSEPHRRTITGGSLSLADAGTFVRHLVVGEEVHKPDMLSSLRIEISITESRLAALPFEEHKKGIRCCLTGITL